MLAKIFVLVVAIQHILFMALEMLFWTKPLGMKIFKTTPEFAQASAMLAANQGLYNGFLAAGLLWSLMHPDPAFSRQIAYFFLVCVIVAGAFGALTVSPRILLLQALPAILAFGLVYLRA
jgi:putative membrane protein